MFYPVSSETGECETQENGIRILDMNCMRTEDSPLTKDSSVSENQVYTNVSRFPGNGTWKRYYYSEQPKYTNANSCMKACKNDPECVSFGYNSGENVCFHMNNTKNNNDSALARRGRESDTLELKEDLSYGLSMTGSEKKNRLRHGTQRFGGAEHDVHPMGHASRVTFAAAEAALVRR